MAHTAVWVERPGREHHAYGVAGRRPQVLHDPAPVVADNFIPLSSSLVRREAIERAGGFDAALSHAEDLDFWIRLLEQGSVLVLPDIGAIYHLHADQATKDVAATVRGHREAVGRYRDRPWWPRSALAAVEVRAAWDERRRAQAGRSRSAALELLAWLLARPGRALLLARLLARRFTLRRAGARVDHQGRPVLALMPGTAPPADDQAVHVVDLRDVPAPARLGSLIRRAPSAALCATRGQQLLCRLLGIHHTSLEKFVSTTAQCC